MNVAKVIVAALFAASVSMAQDIYISGTVTDTGGAPIPSALLRLEKAGVATATGADGSFMFAYVNVNGPNNKSLLLRPSAAIHGGLLCVNVREKSEVEITTFTLQGQAVSRARKTMEAGSRSLTLPELGAGVYLHKVKVGKDEFLIKSHYFGCVSGGTAGAFQGPSSDALAKQAKAAATINDVLAVTKNGYLNYRVIVTNSDTSGIEIKMIACAGTVTDADGNEYQTVKIGKQIWTVENLRTTKNNDGAAIPMVTANAAWGALTAPGYCYYNNTANTDSIKKFGALYNWYSIHANKFAPAGWHVPDTAEWNTLQNYLIANGYNYDGTTSGNKTAKSLAAKVDWLSSTGDGVIGNDLRANNRTGFSAFPGGCRTSSGFYDIGGTGHWWSATEADTSNSWRWYLYTAVNGFSRISTARSCGSSVRLVRDTVAYDVDGNIYHTVIIGTQTWMVENLKTTKYNDGTAIPLATDNIAWADLVAPGTPGYCWYNNDVANKATYGALYNYFAIRTGKLVPTGWHVPTHAEWDTLTKYLGGTNVAGGKLKETGTTYWHSPNTGATNETGFSAVGGGMRYDVDGSFSSIGLLGKLWSSTPSNANHSWNLEMGCNDGTVYDAADGNGYGLSIRCIRNP